ncbi:uncharacterized protein LOC144916795 isoform X2 [Branchiostoma floridae x Branchiostoma belcheri]
MPVDKKAERFVNRLAHKFNSDECVTMGEAKFRSMFQTAVDDLPDNKKLKDFLVDNFDMYFNKLWRNVCGITSAHETAPGSAEHRYNLRAADGLRSALTWVGTLPQAEQMPHYLNLFQRWFPSVEGSDALLDNIISSKKDDLDCLVTLTQLLNLNNQAVALQKVAAAFVRRLEQAYENCLQEDLPDRAAELREIVLRFLMVLNIQRDPAVKWEDPGYEDLVAAFVSVYVDLSLLVTRTQLSSKSDGKVSEVSQSIGNCILVWLGHSPTHILDVLLQSEAEGERDGAILTPVYRRFLHTAPSPLTHLSYIRYMCAVCKARDIIPQNSPAWKSLQKAALSTPAPPSFLQWLCSSSAELMDQVPNTPKWTGSHVTKFLLMEASQDFRENLLDLLTEGLGQSDSVETEVKVQAEKETRPGDDTDLFFVDISKDEGTAAQMGTGDPDQDHSGKEIQILGEIHTLLGGINVGEDMPEEKDDSEDSDVEEVEFKVPKSKAKRKEEVAEIVAQSLKTYRRQSMRRRAQEERDSTSGPWAVKSPVSPLHVRAVQKDSRDSIDSTQEQAVDVESSKLEESEESMSAATGEDISDVPQQMEVIKISSADEVEDEEELVKQGRDIPKSVDKGQKKDKKGKKKSKKESKKGGRKEDKLERSFGDIKCLEGESYDSTQESVEMMAFKATASELLQDVEKFMHITKETLPEDTDKEESKTDKSEGIKEVETAGNVENGEDDSFQPEITVSDEENEVEKDNESVEVECDADSGELSDAEKEESQDTSINQMEESPTVEEQGLADVQDVSDSEESDSDDEGLTSTILKLRQNLVAPTSMAEPALDQSEVIPLAVEEDERTTAGEVVAQAMEEEEVVEEGPAANVVEIGETEKKNIFKTPVSPARGKSSPARANFSPSKASPVKTAGGAASTTARKRRLSTDDELRELAAEVTEKIAQENSEDDVKSLAPSTPPQKSSDKRRRSMLGQSYGKYIEKQTFPDVIIEGTDTGDKMADQTDLVSDQTKEVDEDTSSAVKDQDSPSEHETSEDPEASKVDKSETVCSDEVEGPSNTLRSSKMSAKEAKAREPTPMVKRERRKTAQQTLQPVGEVPSHDSDSSVSSSNRRKSLRRRKLDLKDAEQETLQSKTETQKQSGNFKMSEEIPAQPDESVQVLEDEESEETTMEVTPTEETADVDKQKGEEEDDVTLAQPISDSANSEQPAESSTGKKKQGKVLRMVKTPTPRKRNGEEQRIKLVSPQGSPEVQFATSGHIVVRVSSDSPDHKPVILHSPTGELIIKAHNPRVVVAPDLTGDPKRLDFNTGTGDKDGGQPAEETGTKGEASSATKGKMVLRTRSRSPIPSDSGSMTSVSSMSEAGTKSRRKSRRSSRKVEPVLQEEGDEKDDKDLTMLDTAVPSTSGTRSRRSKVPKDGLSQQMQLASDSDLSVSSQSSSKRRRSKAAVVASDQDISDSQGIRRSSRKRAKGKAESPPKKLKTTEEEEDVETRQKETDSGPELIVLDSSPVQGTQEDQTEAVGITRPVTRSRVKRETLSNASSVSDQSALDSEQEGSISARTRSSRKRRSEHAGKITRSAVMAETEAKKRLSML